MPDRSRRRESATSTTSPPAPPSPPSGPPFGTYFSRRKWIDPSPPRPPCTHSRARSWNTTGLVDDGNEAALAARPERDLAGARREDRVVLADARAGAWAEARAALADEDHPRLHVLAGEELDAEHLRVRVTAVPRRAQTFLVCHLVLLLRNERGLERRDRALAVRVRLLVVERGLDVRPPPRRDVLLDLGDRHVLVALRRMRGARGGGGRRFRLGRGRCRAPRLGYGLRLVAGHLCSLLRGGLLRADGLDLDPRQ